MRLTARLALVPLLACAGCAVAPKGPKVEVPEALRAPADEHLVRTLEGNGVQIYECRAKPGDANEAAWAFVAPEAVLRDSLGNPAGRHFAGPGWEAPDGSRILGKVKAQAPAPTAGAIPWLLLETHSDGPAGQFSSITSVQRVATVGGVAPATGCTTATIGQRVTVPYTAQYVQYAK